LYYATFFNPQNWNILEKIISSVKRNILQILERKATSFLKGQCHEIFRFWFFSWFSFPHAPDYTIRAVSNFFENSPRYSQLKVCHRKWKNLQSEIFFMISFGHLWVVELAYRWFFFKFILICQQFDNCSYCLPQV
jgi:hypothetical protein